MATRVCVITFEEGKDPNFGPDNFTKKLREHGIKFDSETCPVKITKPWEAFQVGNGDYVYVQWDSETRQ